MIWLNVDGYNGEYQLSEKGDLRRRNKIKGTRIVKSCVASNNKRYVTLWDHGKRKNIMLHNLYADTFRVSVRTAMQILYEGYEGDTSAANRVRAWLIEKVQECERAESLGVNMHDDVLYLKSFLDQINSLL